MACWIVATIGTRGCGGMTAVLLRLPPGAQVFTGAGHQSAALIADGPQLLQSHVQDRGFGIARPLVVDEELLQDDRQELEPRLFLAGLDQRGAAELLDDRRRTLVR